MKIMICIPQLVKGGAERVVSNLSNYLSNDNQIILISTRKLPSEYDINSKVKILFLDKNKIEKGKILKLIKRIKRLKKIIDYENPDIILCFLPSISFMTLFIKLFKKINVIVSVRNDPKVEYNNFLKKMIMKILYSKADGFVFQTKEAKEFFPYKIQKKSTIIMNSINEEFFMDKIYEGKREKKIVSVGRLSEQKNQIMLIKAFEKIYTEFPNYVLIIYGEGENRKNLQAYIDKRKLNERIYLPGVENNIKNQIYNAALFVLSSNYEGMPNALLEAMCLGIPSISTNCPCGGPAEIIENNVNGILVEVGNIEELAKNIRKILKNEKFSKKLSENALNLRKMVSPNVVNQKWENYIINVYKECKSKNKKR